MRSASVEGAAVWSPPEPARRDRFVRSAWEAPRRRAAGKSAASGGGPGRHQKSGGRRQSQRRKDCLKDLKDTKVWYALRRLSAADAEIRAGSAARFSPKSARIADHPDRDC